MESVIHLSWYCSNYVGQAKWQNTEDYEPDECNTEFETEDSKENWNEEMCYANCPTCGSKLSQKYDKPEIVTQL